MRAVVHGMAARTLSIGRVLGLVTTLVGTAFAQDSADSHALLEPPRARQGYWIAFGLSGVASNLIETGKDLGVYGGYGYSLRVGQLVTKRLGLGLLYEAAGSLMGGIKKGSDEGGLGGLTLEGTCTIWRNLAIHSGLGVGYVYVRNKSALDTSLRGGAGSYFLVGTSYDFFPWHRRITGGWAITPTLDLHVMPDGNVHTFTMFAGVQIVRWSGLPDNMLLLPDE